jgi:hypothetical protein
MPRTYEPIASNTIGSGGAASFTFSSIPATYTDLRVVVVDQFTNNYNMGLRFNSDSGSNYSDTQIYGTGSAAASARQTSQTSMFLGYTGTSAPNVTIFDVMSYANTNVNKTVLSQSAAPARAVTRTVGLWRSTAAITSIEVYIVFGGPINLPQNTTLSLFGIKAA